MRASEVRRAIIAAVEAIQPDHRATPADVFRHVDLGQITAGVSLPDRSFYVALESPPRDMADMTDNLFQVGYSVQVFYAASPTIDDRIGADVEKLIWALPQIPAGHNEVASASVLSTSVGEDEGGIDVVVLVEVTYRLDDLSA